MELRLTVQAGHNDGCRCSNPFVLAQRLLSLNPTLKTGPRARFYGVYSSQTYALGQRQSASQARTYVEWNECSYTKNIILLLRVHMHTTNLRKKLESSMHALAVPPAFLDQLHPPGRCDRRPGRRSRLLWRSSSQPAIHATHSAELPAAGLRLFCIRNRPRAVDGSMPPEVASG